MTSTFERVTETTVAPSADAAITAFAAMTDEDLKAFIEPRLGPEEPQALWEALLSPEVVDRTVGVLADLLRGVNLQVNTRREDLKTLQLKSVHGGQDDLAVFLDAKAEFDQWKRRVNGYRSLAERRFRQANTAARSAKRTAHNRHQAKNQDRHRAVASRLAIAVLRHREESLDADIKPEPHDRDLWALLDELTVECGNEMVTLAQAIEYGYWVVREGE